MNLEPLGDRIVVRADVPDEKTASGLIIPDMAKEQPTQGTVLAVGPLVDPAGFGLAPGDKVVYSRHGGQVVQADDGEVLILIPRDIMARVKDPG